VKKGLEMLLKEEIVAECRKIFRNFPEVNTENHATLRVIGVQAKTEPIKTPEYRSAP